MIRMIKDTRLVLGLLMLCLLMTATGCQDKLKQERDALWNENVELRDQLAKAQSALDASEAERNSLVSELNRLQSSPAPTPVAVSNTGASGFEGIAGIETERRAGNIYVRVPGDVLFAPGKVDVRTTSQKTLNEIAQVLRSKYSGNTVRIEGYTDTDPIRKSNWTDNLELSLQRAAAVHRYLQKQGVPFERMYAAGFGANKPRATKEKSRRVEIVVLLNE